MKYFYVPTIFRKLLVFCFCASFSNAGVIFSLEVAPTHPLTLVNLLDIALANNPETHAAWWNAQRAAAAVGSARSSYYPQVGFNVNVTNGQNFEFTNGPNVSYTTISAEIILTLMVADFGERAANVEAFMRALDAAGWDSEFSIQKVMSQVLENGYSLAYAHETLEALLISLDDAKLMLDAAVNLNNAGLSPISDVYTSKSALAQIQIEVAQQKAQVEIQTATLATTLGFSPETPLPLATLDPLKVPEMKVSELIALATAKRRDLMAKRARLSEAIARQKRVWASYNPKISLTGVGGAQHFIRDKSNAGNYQITLNYDVPLFTGFDATYQNRQAYADVKISALELAQLELDIALEVLTQAKTVESSREMLLYAKENLINAQAAYEGTLSKYNAGKERIAELSIALRQIVTARVRYSEISSRYLVAIANLAFATGTLGPNMEDSCVAK